MEQDDKKLTMSPAEFQTARDLAVTKALLKQLQTDYAKHLEEGNKVSSEIKASLGLLREEFARLPDRMSAMRRDIERDMNVKLDQYMTKKDGELLEGKLEAKIDTINNKIKWTVIAVSSIVGSVQFILYVVYTGYQLAASAAWG